MILSPRRALKDFLPCCIGNVVARDNGNLGCQMLKSNLRLDPRELGLNVEDETLQKLNIKTFEYKMVYAHTLQIHVNR